MLFHDQKYESLEVVKEELEKFVDRLTPSTISRAVCCHLFKSFQLTDQLACRSQLNIGVKCVGYFILHQFLLPK